MSDIILSIVIPIYNSDKYLYDTLLSFSKEDLRNVEIICVDDGSTDNSPIILREFEIKHNFIVLHQTNQGGSVARNNGTNIASGEYIWYFDSDDLLIEGSINVVKNCIKKKKYDLYITDFISFDDKKIISIYKHRKKTILFSKNDKLLYLYLRPPFPGNKIYRKEIIQKYNIIFADVRIGQDLNFYLKYLCHIQNIKYIKKYTTRYRIHSGSISTSYDKRILNIIDCFKDIKKHYNIYDCLTSMNNYIDIVYYSSLVEQVSKLNKFDEEDLRTNIFGLLRQEIRKIRMNIIINSLYEKYIINLLDLEYKKIIDNCKNIFSC